MSLLTRIMRLMVSAIIIVVIFNVALLPQLRPNSIYFEALGNGGLYSVNYDRLFTDNFGGRLGLMYLSEVDIFFVAAEDILIFPATLNYFIGEKHKLELGAGVVFASVSNTRAFGFKSDSDGSNIVGTATIGYRYQKPDGGFLFRVGFTPLFGSEGIEPWGGISLGYSF
jgi:hypothetical protein